MPDPGLLTFKNVNPHYGDLHVLKDVNYTIGQGEIVSLLGGNASGKSTTMKTIMGVVRPTTGSVLFDGVAIENLSTAERVRRDLFRVAEACQLVEREGMTQRPRDAEERGTRTGRLERSSFGYLDRGFESKINCRDGDVHPLRPHRCQRVQGRLIPNSEQALDVRIARQEVPRDLPDFRRVGEVHLFDLEVGPILFHPVIDRLGALLRAEVIHTEIDQSNRGALGDA